LKNSSHRDRETTSSMSCWSSDACRHFEQKQFHGWDSGTDTDISNDVPNPWFIHGRPGTGLVALLPFPPSTADYPDQRATLPTHEKEKCHDQDEHPAAEQCETDPQVPTSTEKRGRPCKAQRDRFRKMIDQLKRDVHLEPDKFDVNKISLPPWVATNLKSVGQVKTMMQTYQDQVRKGVLPDLDSKQFK